MKSRFTGILTLFLAFMIQFSFAQEKTITGTVTSAEYGALIGAAVTVDGTTRGTQTDENGIFSISAQQGDVLTVSYVGMKDSKINVGSSNVYNIVMQTQERTIDEVVVTGFTSQRADQVSSATVKVSAAEMEKLTPITSVDNMLQGKAAGVQVIANSGRPGQGARIMVRGANSLNGSSNPLFVVDGVYMTSSELISINPNDIESQVILKDAAATSLYGARGANGVIVITTKRAKEGRTQFRLNTSIGFSERTKLNDFKTMNASQFLNLMDKYSSVGYPGLPNYTDEQRATLIANGEHWEDNIYKQGYNESVQFQVLSSDDKTNFLASLSSDKNTGLVSSFEGLKRISGRIKVDTKMKHDITMGANIAMSYTSEDLPRESYNGLSPMYTAFATVPTRSVYEKNPDGSLALDNDGNPIYSMGAGIPSGLNYFDIYDNYLRSNRRFRTFGGFYAQMDDMFTKGLSAKTEFTGIYTRSAGEQFTTPGSNIDIAFNGSNNPFPGNKNDSGSDDLDYRWVNTLRYVRTLGENHNFDLSVFSELNKWNFYSYNITSSGYPNSFLQVQSVGTNPITTTTGRSDRMSMGYGANLFYDYDDRYLATASFRRDANSSFGKDNRVGYFPGFSLAWKISNEDFFNVSAIDLLKVRASWGKRGTIDELGLYSTTNIVFPNYNDLNGAAPSLSITSPDLGWASSETFNYGLEFQAFNRRLTGAIDYFVDIRSDFLFTQNLSHEGGAYNTQINAGEFTNKGIEVSLNYDLIRNQDFLWNIYGNFTFIKNEIKDLNGLDELFAPSGAINRVGETINSYYMVRYAGVNPANGEPLYYDADGNITNIYDGDDAVLLKDKSPIPKFYGGFGTAASYKGFDLSFDFSYQGGNYIENIANNRLLDPIDGASRNYLTDATNFWTTPGDTGVLPSPLNTDGTIRTYQDTDQFLQKGDYIRLRSVNFGYTLGNKFLGEKSGIESVRFYLQGQNLYTWTAFRGDPEVGYWGENNGVSGATAGTVYLWQYPNARTFLFGVQLTF